MTSSIVIVVVEAEVEVEAEDAMMTGKYFFAGPEVQLCMAYSVYSGSIDEIRLGREIEIPTLIPALL
jgi:hypothetical protein